MQFGIQQQFVKPRLKHLGPDSCVWKGNLENFHI